LRQNTQNTGRNGTEAMKTESVKPSNILYGLEDKPPLLISILLAFQHICVMTIGLALPVLVVRMIGGTAEQAEYMVSMSLVAAGIGVFVQSLRRGPVGSGYLCPQVCGPSFLAASILAVKTGGLSLLCGTTLIAGVFEAFLSRFVRRLKLLFPTEVTGLIVSMVGITIIRLAMVNFLGGAEDSQARQGAHILASIITLGVMVGLNIWGKGRNKLFCVLIGITVGYAVCFMAGLLDASSLKVVASAPWFRLSLAGHPGFSFSAKLIFPLLIATVCSNVKSVGDIITCQRINDSNWKRPDMENAGRGILADSIGTLSAGLLGGIGQSTSSSNVGLEIATGVTSRALARIMAALLILLALCPKVSAVFAIMPASVIGGTMIFSLSFMIVAGIQIIMSRAIDARKTFVIGLSMIVGLSVDVLPGAFENLPAIAAPIFGSSLSAATFSAVLLNLLFRIGIRKKAFFTPVPEADIMAQAAAFMEKQGGLWAMRRDILQKALAALNELAEALEAADGSRILSIEADFEESLLVLDVQCSGAPPEPPEQLPTGDQLLQDKKAVAGLAVILVRKYADRVITKKTPDGAKISLFFEH
jgi:xanthine permease XanP